MQQISLNGTWQIRWCDGQRGAMPHYIHVPPEPTWLDVKGKPKEIKDDYDPCKWIDAEVPGEVHRDLVRAGIIRSPYEGTGALECRWAEECFWFYRKVFDAPKAAGSKYARLVFEGLDYSAVIYLNGREIARHENAFFPCKIDVSGILKETGNVLLVRLESGLFSVCDKPIRDYYTATMTMDTFLHKRNWLRKTQSQASWDWAPRLMNIGIYMPVSIEFSDVAIVDSAAVNTSLNERLDKGNVRVRFFLSQHESEHKRIALAIHLGEKTQIFQFDCIPEDGILTAEVEIENPELWWPVGYGKQALYDFKATLSIDGEQIFTKHRRIGFRHVTVDQSTHPQEGNYFIFKVNHEPVFMRGANLVPNDMINAAMTQERYEKLVALALEANFNFLRVWGGGVYESDVLYELCNEKGILIWQEFIAACAVVPIGDPELLDSFRKEAVYQTRRLAGHPSLIAWCGNNEIGWAEGTDFHIGEDDPLYDKILPSILRDEDPEKYYQPTSPFSFDRQDYNSPVKGDQHPWDVGFVNKDSRDYEQMVCRFPNEGGVLGPTCLDTVKACLNPGDGMHSFSWQTHDNMLENWMPGSSPDFDVKFWLGTDPRSMTLEEYVYAGGFVQGEGLKRYIDNFRHRKYDSSSAVFWMYNDCWPTVRSWTIVDYYFRRNPSFHPVRRAFEPVAPVIANEDGQYVLYGVNDTLESWNGTIRFGIFTPDGKYINERSWTASLNANSSTILYEGSGEYLGGQYIAYACFYKNDGTLLSRTRYTPEKYMDLNFSVPNISVTRANQGYLFQSDCFAMGVCLDLNGTEQYGDNFFDLLPGQPYFVPSNSEVLPKVLYDLSQFVK